MISSEIRDRNVPLGALLRGAALTVAVFVAFASGATTAEELRLFPEPPPPLRCLPNLPWSGEPEVRIVDVAHSYPWRGGGGPSLLRERPDPSEGEDPQEAPTGQGPTAAQPKPKKLFNTGVTLWTVAALLGGVGQGIGAPIKYGTESWHFTNEGWFGYDTYAGGADKVSHFTISSGVSRLLFEMYELNGLTANQSFNLALATTLMAGIFVETGDAVTVYGWSWQDLAADFLGATSGLLINRYRLQDTIGLRVGPAGGEIPAWAVGSSEESLGSSYNDEIYTADLKLGGVITRLHGNPGVARFFLVSFAYFTRGFGYDPPLPSRYQEMGFELGINFPAILKAAGVEDTAWWGKILYAFFNFFRIPYTQVGVYYNFKNNKWYGPGAPYGYY
jgi:uncharacterized protein YfiM (DUF2279 family)